MSRHPGLFIAVDTTDTNSVSEFCSLARSRGIGLKIGMEAFYGIDFGTLRDLTRDVPIFLDLKLHDIPNTVDKAITSLLGRLTVQIMTVHASGGLAMLTAAAKHQSATPVFDVAGVTILTSMNADDLSVFGVDQAEGKVVELAGQVLQSGCNALVCSGYEVEAVKKLYPDLWTIVPGIRLSGGPNNDQKRVMTPYQAIQAGADSLVVGRTITSAIDPTSALDQILDEMTVAGSIKK